ncbi:MAG: hypothetical protein MUQ30_12980 [Anaerolineae bacterium]|nr:hypothetical protein [Anaerolineae bacterium]
MKILSFTRNIVEGIGGAALMGVHIILLPFLRGYRTRWGTTEEEASADLPGDELVRNPKLRMTWGITINAPIEAVWPWVVQMGQGRGGFYSYQFLENMTGCEIYNADRILPEHQHIPLEAGVSLAPGMPPLNVASHKDGHYYFLHLSMDMTTMEGFDPKQYPYPERFISVGWGFYLQETGENQTRFLSCWLADYDPTLINKIAFNLFLEPIGFVMGRKMLLGTQQRAER